MRIDELLRAETGRISFEVFPPKTDTAFDSVREATEKIAALGPSYMSVTYGAGGGTSKYTLDIAENIMSAYGVPTVAHLTCVSSTRATVRERIRELAARGIKNVLALRGDLTDEQRAGGGLTEYRHATELISDIVESGACFCIGGACYPEGHPESESVERDIYYLGEKVRAGCSFLTTQMFFDNEIFYRFTDRCERAGIDALIIPGVMPITSYRQLERSRELSGSYIPSALAELAERYRDDPESMKRAGVEYALGQTEELLRSGVRNVHIYTMNKPEVAESFISLISGAAVKI